MNSTSKRVRYFDKNYADTVLKWNDELSDEDQYESSDIVDSGDENQPENQTMEEDRHSSTSEQEGSDDEEVGYEPELGRPHSDDDRMNDEEDITYEGKDGYLWHSKEPNTAVKTPRHNIVIKLPSLKEPARSLGNKPNIEEIWNLLFDEAMTNEIVLHTNEKFREVRATHKNKSTDYKDTDFIEIRAFLGLLMFTSIYRSNHENMLSLFSNKATGRPIFRAVMSLKRFENLLICLRFDDAKTRELRSLENPTAAISFIFNSFIENSQKCFNLGPNTCIDEMLISFRGRCSFKMYMPNKPAKYGIKLMCLTDAKISYLYNAYIYVGKDSDGQTLSPEEKTLLKPTQAVLRLIKPVEKTNRNITADNWFSSIELLRELRKKGLTYTGTLKKNKREIPAEFLPSPRRPIESTIYGFSKDSFTLISRVPKKNKAVILVSSMHHSKETDPDNSLPEINSFYNATKGGVDTLDMKCSNYSSGRRCRRWPLAIFYRLIDISTTNAYSLFLHYRDIKPISRRKFIEELAMKLVTPHMRRRVENVKLPREIQTLIRSVLKEDNKSEPSTSADDRLEVKKTCAMCPYQRKRKTFYKCYTCQKPICLEHASKVCKNCITEDR